MLNANNEIKLAILMRIDSKITRDQLAFSLSFGVDKKLKIKLLLVQIHGHLVATTVRMLLPSSTSSNV